MNRKELEKSWEITKHHLAAAIRLLPVALLPGLEGATLQSINENIDHNELELALDDLADMGFANHPPREFWNSLILAVKNMELYDRLKALQMQMEKGYGN